MTPIDKTWPMAPGSVWRLQRGAQYVLAANLYLPGNFTVLADGVGPMPLLVIPAAYQIATLDAEGVYSWTGIEIRGEGTGAGVHATRGAKLVAEDLKIAGFTNGVAFGGDGSTMRRLTVDQCSTGIYGGSRGGYPAPSRGLIQACNIRATQDAITLHDGDGIGSGNVIEDCDLFGDAENGIDILAQYTDTVVQRNRIESARSYPAIWDAPRLTLHANTLHGTRAAIFSRGADAIIVGNSISPLASDSEATLMAFAAGATGQRVHGNAGSMRADTQRAGIKFAPGSSGVCSANYWHNASGQALYGGAMELWRIAA